MYKMLVIGLSAGGSPIARRLLAGLPKDYPLAVAIVAHLPQGYESSLAQQLDAVSGLPVTEVRDKEPIVAGHVYVAPPDYHLLVEQNRPFTFALSEDEPVKSVRPSIDILFSSAAEVFGASLIAVILSGANSDGADGMAVVKQLGGLCMVLDPLEAEFNTMPNAVIKKVDVDYIVSLDDIISLLISVGEK
ncbi:MAG: chemotaxis protein CheB [Methylococcales bacterium]|nr:chemotaxis protein CheB [Methylococcales bacterium]MDD5630614.1 chemotaxis protein CheB [Methylococcales bacterium]